MFGLQFLAGQKLLRVLAEDYESILFEVNRKLKEQSYPPFYYGNLMFNTEYRIDNDTKPRFIGTWFPPFVKLSQFYLKYMPENGKIITLHF